MAIIPETRYAGKIAPASTEYPYGAARNITSPGDGQGTPWEAALVNDLFGFQQALLSGAGITPSGDPDEVGDSQYLDALQKISKLAHANIAAIIALTDPIDTQIEVVIDEGVFIYDSTLSAVNDGIRVFNGWVRQGNGDKFSISGTGATGGAALKTISLSDNSHAELEVYAAGLKGSDICMNKTTFLLYRTTGAMTFSLIGEVRDGGDQGGYFDLVASGDDVILTAYTDSGTWALSGNVTIKRSGTVSIS